MNRIAPRRVEFWTGRADRLHDRVQYLREGNVWKVERLFAWLSNFRRLVVRYERRVENYLGFVQLGCVVILLRHL